MMDSKRNRLAKCEPSHRAGIIPHDAVVGKREARAGNDRVARQESDRIVVFRELEVAFKSFVASFVDTDNVLIIIVIVSGAQALRAARQPVVAGLVLRCQYRRDRFRSGRYRRGYDASPTRMAAPFASGFARL